MVLDASPHQSSASTSSRTLCPRSHARSSAHAGVRAKWYTPVHSAQCSVDCLTNSSYDRAWSHRARKSSSRCCENGGAARTVPGVERELDLANFNAPLRELSHILAERHSLIRRVHSLRGDAAVHLHEAGDGERIPGGPHH